MSTVAFLALATLAYTYLAYPLLIVVAAKLFPQRLSRDESFTPSVSALIPAYNAAGYVSPKIESLLEQEYPADKLEILICSDGSDDGTDAEVQDWAARDPRVRLLRSEVRRGKPNALNIMLGEAKGELLLLTDIRQPLGTRTTLRAMVSMLADDRVGVVSGDIRIRGKTGFGFYWRYDRLIRNAQGRFRGRVGATGAIYLLRKRDMAEVPTDIVLDDMFIAMRVSEAGRRLLVCEEAFVWDEAFDERREFDRKVRTLAGAYQLFARMPKLLVPIVNRIWLETVSHRFMRLVCPWALLVLFFASALAVASSPADDSAVGWSMKVLLAAQVGFYLCALLGSRLGKLGTIARTFVSLNAAAIVGLWRYLRSSQRITW